MKTPADLARFEATLEHDAAAIHCQYDALSTLLSDFTLATEHISAVRLGGDLAARTRPPRSPRVSLRLHEYVLDGMISAFSSDKFEAGLTAIGSVILPLTGIPLPSQAPREVEMSRHTLSGCKLAEPRFDEVLQLARGLQPADQSMINVYHDEDSTPILLQKTKEPNALALEPLTIIGLDDGTDLNTNGEVHIPAGSLVAVSGYPREFTGENRDAHAFDGTELSTWTFDGVTVHPMRLSAWAYPEEEDRRLFAINRPFADPDVLTVDKVRADMLSETTLDDFREAARFVMAACGTLPEFC